MKTYNHRPSRYEFAREMTEVCTAAGWGEGPESNHEYADELMCALLRKLGYGAAVDVFLSSDRWYS